MTGFLNLPVTVLIDTVQLLCQHCHPIPRAYGSLHGRKFHCSEACDLALPDPLSLAALTSLCRTSKFLNLIATPILYHSLYQKWSESPLDDVPLYRTILSERPDLARHVRSVHLPEIELDRLPSEFVEELKPILKIVSLFDLEEDFEDTGSCQEDGNQDGNQEDDSQEDENSSYYRRFQNLSMPMFVVRLCPGLQELSIQLDGMDDIADCIELEPLPQLKTLYIALTNNQDQLDTHRLQTIFMVAPGLATLTISHLRHFQQSKKWANLRELTLLHSCLKADEIKLLLQDCPALESFAYDIHIYNMASIPSLDTYPRDLIAAISESTSNKFRSLSLNLSRFWSVWQSGESMGSLRSLELLERLEVELQSLLGNPDNSDTEDHEAPGIRDRILSWNLPMRIQFLIIEVSCATEFNTLTSALIYLAKVCSDDFPDLKRIIVRGTYMDFQASGVSNIVSNFAESGVNLELHHQYIKPEIYYAPQLLED